MRSVLESKEFILDRYRKHPDRTNAPDRMEKILWTIIAIFSLVMVLARVDTMMERHKSIKSREKITLTYEDTKNNPGRVEPISNYIAGVND